EAWSAIAPPQRQTKSAECALMINAVLFAMVSCPERGWDWQDHAGPSSLLISPEPLMASAIGKIRKTSTTISSGYLASCTSNKKINNFRYMFYDNSYQTILDGLVAQERQAVPHDLFLILCHRTPHGQPIGNL